MQFAQPDSDSATPAQRTTPRGVHGPRDPPCQAEWGRAPFPLIKIRTADSRATPRLRQRGEHDVKQRSRLPVECNARDGVPCPPQLMEIGIATCGGWHALSREQSGEMLGAKRTAPRTEKYPAKVCEPMARGGRITSSDGARSKLDMPHSNLLVRL